MRRVETTTENGKFLSWRLPVEGMTCAHCADTVARALLATPGVIHAEVSLPLRSARVDTAPGGPARQDLADAIHQAGYDSPLPVDELVAQPELPAPATSPPQPSTSPRESLLLDITGMHCASCTGRVEKALTQAPGVTTARANLATEQASVEWDPARGSIANLLATVAQAGYTAKVAGGDGDGHRASSRSEQQWAGWRRRFIVGLSLLTPLVILHFVGHHFSHHGWWSLAPATALQLYLGGPFLAGAWQRLKHGEANMDTLVALGTGAAYLAGLADAWRGHASMYFMDGGLILVTIALGRALEAKAKGRTSSAIRKLLDLTPPQATVLRGGAPLTVHPREIRRGETLLVRPGERVPLDAKILTGHSEVNQSWLTGESLPVEKQPGDEILAATINGQGALTAEVIREAGQTTLAQVIELVRRAQESKPRIGRLADRVVGWFVPAVLAVAAATLIGWGLAGDWSSGLSSAIAVLVVACPCALGLATPTAILVASSCAAEAGIFIKEAQALETAGSLTTVVFDKTGTLTLGRPQVTEVHAAAGGSADEVLRVAAAVERLSQHPLAEPIVAAASERGVNIPTATELQVIPGVGVQAKIDGRAMLVGSERLLTRYGIDVSNEQEAISAARARGEMVVLVAADGRLLGYIALADELTPHSSDAVEQLQSRGLKVVLLSGDHTTTVQRVAARLGIAHFEAEVAPADKQATIARLRASGETVAMVGDGINDAPALAAADLAIAIGAGSDIAKETADVVIAGADPRGVVRTVALAQATLRTIKQNLWWAFFYNILLIPLAAGALVPLFGVSLPPALSALAMALSSVSVVANSLLLRRRMT